MKIVSVDNLNKKALEIKGGDADPSHYTLCLLDRKVPDDYECSVKFRIQSGEGVRAAGVFFRMQDNRSDYYLLAVKPEDKKLFWTVFKNNKPVLCQKDNQLLELTTLVLGSSNRIRSKALFQGFQSDPVRASEEQCKISYELASWSRSQL